MAGWCIAVIVWDAMTETQDIILKSDRRGRIRFTPEQRTAILDAYDASGLSGPKFAQLHGVNYQTFGLVPAPDI